jgi:GLPGLI family protein
MKRIILLAGLLAGMVAAHIVLAQTNQGVVMYEEKVNMHRRLPADSEGMKAMIPEYRISNFQLFFNDQVSHYKRVIEDEDEAFGNQEGGVRMMVRVPNNELYLNGTTRQIIGKQEFMGKEYLIIDSLKMAPWKFGTDTKTIAGYECKQAYYTDETNPDRKAEITAWYTDKIRPFLGPDRFNTLPGAVLALDVNNGERILVAKKVELKQLKKNDIKIPTGGQRTTQAEYKKIVEEQMKKMGATGGVMIRGN